MNTNEQKILDVIEMNLDADGYCMLQGKELIKACELAHRTFYDRVNSLLKAGLLSRDSRGRYSIDNHSSEEVGWKQLELPFDCDSSNSWVQQENAGNDAGVALPPGPLDSASTPSTCAEAINGIGDCNILRSDTTDTPHDVGDGGCVRQPATGGSRPGAECEDEIDRTNCDAMTAPEGDTNAPEAIEAQYRDLGRQYEELQEREARLLRDRRYWETKCRFLQRVGVKVRLQDVAVVKVGELCRMLQQDEVLLQMLSDDPYFRYQGDSTHCWP